MINKIMQRLYTEQQLDQAYESLPEELKDALFSNQTTYNLLNACEQYGITDERTRTISEYVGYVLMGILLPSDFQGILQKEVGLPEDTAQKLALQINRFVFYPVRPLLEQLHKMEIGASPGATQTEQVKEQPKSQEEKPGEEQKGTDTYREPIE